MTGKTIVVIGAGISGLVAAHRLGQAGYQVTILEAQDTIGGRIGEQQIRGITFKRGARLLYGFSPEFNNLIAELGLKPSLVPIRRLSAACQGVDGNWEIELMPGPKSLATPGLKLFDRARLVWFGIEQFLNQWRTNPNDALSVKWADHETLAAYVTRKLGKNVLDRLVAPVFQGARAWNPNYVSAAFFASVTPHLVGRSTVYVLKNGMNSLTAALSKGKDIQLETRVITVETPPDGRCRITTIRNGEQIEFAADIVVCAIEGDRVPAIFRQLSPEEIQFFEAVKYNPIGIMHYQINQEPADYMTFFDNGMTDTLSVFQTEKGDDQKAHQVFGQLSPDAVVSVQQSGQQENPHEVIAERLSVLFPGIDAQIVDRHPQWIERMLPLFYPGYLAKLEAFKSGRNGARQNVYFCGDYLAQALVTGAAHSGFRVADQIANDWQSGKEP